MADQPDKKLAEEARERLKECRSQKDHDRADMEEAYFFVAPRRARNLATRGATTNNRVDDAGDLAIDLGIEAAQDFANFMLNTFLPEAEPWAERGQGQDIPDQIWKRIERDVKAADAHVFEAMKASHFRSAAAQAFFPDLAVGTVGMWIADEVSYAPIQCRPIPIRELEINVGPDGSIDDRFVVQQRKYRHLPRLLPGITLPQDVAQKVKNSPGHKVEVRWGFWRQWDRDDDVVWQAVIMVGEKVVHQTELVGVGSCPLLVSRFNPDTMFAFGEGPTITSLPTLRTFDEATNTTLDIWDLRVNPPFGYPDDGTVNFEGGLKAGTAYPHQPGSGRDYAKLFFEGDIDFGLFTAADFERRIRRLHFVDEPIQRGDTPPSATQWWEETVRAQRRIGMPGQIFWREFCAETFLRFDFLMRERGVIAPIVVDGKAVSLTPYNPAMKAAQMQEVETSVRLNETLKTLFPEMHQILVDAEATAKNWQNRMGDKLTVFNDPEKMAETAKQLAMMAGQAGMLPGQEQPGGGGE